MQHEWIKIDEAHPLPEGQEVIAYNKEWIYGYHNYSGTRIGFLNSQGEFVSARWLDTQESYETSLEDGDDYDTTRIVDGKRLHYVFGLLQEHFSKEVAECVAVGLFLVYPAFIGCGFYGEINPSGIHYVSVFVDGDMSSLAFGDFLQFFGEEELTVL